MARRRFRERLSRVAQHRVTKGIGGVAAEVGIPVAVGAGANWLGGFLAQKSQTYAQKWWAEPATLLPLAMFGCKIPIVNKVLTPANRHGLSMVACYTGKIHYDPDP